MLNFIAIDKIFKITRVSFFGTHCSDGAPQQSHTVTEIVTKLSETSPDVARGS